MVLSLLITTCAPAVTDEEEVVSEDEDVITKKEEEEVGAETEKATTEDAKVVIEGETAPQEVEEEATLPSETYRSGWIYEDETWSGTVHITGDVGVHHEATLTIQPGTRILFAAHQDDQHAGSVVPMDEYIAQHDDPACTLEYAQSHSQLDVYGTLIARGTPDNMITFTSDSPTPDCGDWVQLHICHGSIVEYCILEYARGALDVGEGTGDTVLISHNTIRNNLYTALTIHSSSSTVTYNDIHNSGGHQGIAVIGEGSAPYIAHNVIEECKGGIHISIGTAPIVEYNILIDNDGGIGAMGPDTHAIIRHNSVSSPNGPSQHWTCDGKPVYFSSALMGDDDYIYGIFVNDCSPVITNNDVFQCNWTGIVVMGNSSPTIEYNSIYENRRGILFGESFTGSPNISDNNIHGNYFSHISLYSEQPVSIINNWWGTTDLDMIQVKILDFYGNPLSRLVTFEPILTEPVEIE